MSKLMIVEVPSYTCEFKGIREVAELIRCKECKHRYTPDCFRAYLEYDIQEWVVDSGDDDDFCSYGEREGE